MDAVPYQLESPFPDGMSMASFFLHFRYFFKIFAIDLESQEVDETYSLRLN